LDERVIETLYFIRRADGENAASLMTAMRSATPNASRVVRYDERRDLNAPLEVENFLAMTTAESGSSSLVGSS